MLNREARFAGMFMFVFPLQQRQNNTYNTVPSMRYCTVLSAFTRNLQGQLPKLRLGDADAAEPAISFHAWMEFR